MRWQKKKVEYFKKVKKFAYNWVQLGTWSHGSLKALNSTETSKRVEGIVRAGKEEDRNDELRGNGNVRLRGITHKEHLNVSSFSILVSAEAFKMVKNGTHRGSFVNRSHRATHLERTRGKSFKISRSAAAMQIERYFSCTYTGDHKIFIRTLVDVRYKWNAFHCSYILIILLQIYYFIHVIRTL